MIRFLAGLALIAAPAAGPSAFGFDIPAAPGHRPGPLDAGSPGVGPAGLVCLRDGSSLVRLRPGERPERLDLTALARTAIARDVMRTGDWDERWDMSLMVDTTIQFDARGTAFTLLIPRYSNLKRAVLLWSRDGCRSWRAAPLASRAATMEKAGAFTDRAGPPTIVSYETHGGYTGKRLWLDLFRWQGDALVRRAAPLLAADDSLLTGNHSGGGNSTWTGQGRIVLVYPAATAGKQGALIVSRELDLRTLAWAAPAAPVGRSTTAGANDNHDLPAIARLPSGRLITVVGAHHAQFRLFESRKAGTTLSGWGAPQPVGDPARGGAFAEYSYTSLNVARDGTINIVARAEGRGGHYDLVQLRRRPNGSWLWPDGQPHRLIAAPKRHAYAAWRQRVSEAPDGTLYLFFSYFPNRLSPVEATAMKVARSGARDCTQPDGRCWYPDVPTFATRTLVSHDAGATWE
ncbi:hypothetical protein [Sphingomonas jatrophae]|uniref:BNR repeat-like domain-containing protein n=1 Tax=Sphingomonas jatrophae TaxID=1166337 RepID=A0A1I6M5P3_9SPHN|nr:hypothetical protein [Sphingomonas jatrophae]SFS10938.1 hypothetical protein SAMN05192580_3493 [Sphingomonas jatrophae]